MEFIITEGVLPLLQQVVQTEGGVLDEESLGLLGGREHEVVEATGVETDLGRLARHIFLGGGKISIKL